MSTEMVHQGGPSKVVFNIFFTPIHKDFLRFNVTMSSVPNSIPDVQF